MKHFIQNLRWFTLSLLLAIGSTVWASEVPYKTLTFPDGNSGKVSGYTATWSATINGFTWDIVNFNNNNNQWDHIRCGRQSNASVAMITTSSPIDKEVTKVVVTLTNYTATYVNSAYLEVASNENFTDAQKIEVAITTSATTQEVTYTISTPATNQYYRLTYDCKGSNSTVGNGFIRISKVVYYAENDGSIAPSAPTFSPAGGEVKDGTQVTLTQNDAAMIMYTTDGTDPDYENEIGKLYDTPIIITGEVGESITIKAIAIGDDESVSEISSATYTIKAEKRLVTEDAEGNLNFDFSDNDWGFPVSSNNQAKEEQKFTNLGYTITLAANTGYYYNTDGYLLLGKTGSTLILPAFDFDVERIEVVGRQGASSSVVQNIYVGDEEVSTATTGAEGTNRYDIKEDYQAAGNIYTLKVTSNHNTQITAIKVYRKIDVAISSVGYATLYYGTTALEVPEGVKAYTYTQTEDGIAVEKTYEAGNAIPAGEAVVLQGEPKTYTFKRVTTGNTASETNALHGSDVAAITTDGDKYYALSLNAESEPESVGFYFVKEGGAEFECPAHRAYLALKDNGNGVKSFYTFGETEATGISNIATSTTNAGTIYNLQGQRVNVPTRGIYIVNGKKVFIK